jgi:hypothetical protein
VGWLLLGGLGLSASASGVVDGYASYGLLVRSGRLPAAGYVALYGPTLLAIAITTIGFILLLTPTGKLPSHRWRWWARAAAAAPVVVLLAVTLLPQPLDPDYQAVANPLGLRALEGPLFAAISIASGLTVVGVLVAAASLALRFRHARGTDRQQLRWVASTAAVVSLAAALVVVAMLTQISALFGWGLTLCAAVLPLGIGAAILRYRLYDLDRIISRTLAYGLLTLLLGGGYAGVALGLGQLLGRRSRLTVAVATLAVAAAFQPARRRIQWLGGPALQPPPLRCQPHHCGVHCAATPAGRPGYVDRRAAGGRRADHAADRRIAVAATFHQRVRPAAQYRRIPVGVTADDSFPVGSH